MTNAQIAEAMGLHESTIKSYFSDPTGKNAVLQMKRLTLKKRGLVMKDDADKEAGRKQIELPVSAKIRARPVWRRRQRRLYGQGKLRAPSEEEKMDAIRVLWNERWIDEAPALYFEAFLIMDEAGR